ncbi:CaiB/BaiF CoA transferase family protein [Chloroflexota bacterium]
MAEGALSGIRILDFSRAIAGPYGTLLLADLGAEVIKIDQVPSEIKTKATALDADWAVLFGFPVSEEVVNTPDGKRRWAQREAHFQSLNRNKKRLSLNLNNEKGREVFHELVKKADVVYDNFRPAIVKSLGIDFDTLKQVNPKIVCCSLSGYGKTGPWRDAPGWDVILQALGGEMSMTGMPGSPPCRSGIAIGDLVGGTFAALGVLSAVQARDRTGIGQMVDVSMLDVQISLLNYRVGQYSATGDIPGPVGSGHSGFGQIPYGAYVCKDGAYIAVSAGTPKHWSRFIRAIGLPELEDDLRFNTNSKRQDNVELITNIIEGMLLTKTAQEWQKIFFDTDVAAGIVNNVAEAISHPQVVERDMAVSIEQEIGEKWKFAGNPIKIQGTDETFEPAPGMGEDTAEILSGVLGYSKERLDELEEMDAIWVTENQ